MTALTEWQNFYVIVGSSAGALIGLQFVVMALIAGLQRPQSPAGAAFATPTIVHFGTALMLAGVMSAPWHGITYVRMLLGLMGFLGVLYVANVTLRMRKQKIYKPEFEDWLFHAALPCLAYALLMVAAYAESTVERQALFGVATAALLLLFIGIHNAWDSVTYHVFVRSDGPKETP